MARAREGSAEGTVFWEGPLERRVGGRPPRPCSVRPGSRPAQAQRRGGGSSPGGAARCGGEGPRGRLAEHKPGGYKGVRQSRAEAGSGRGALRAARTPGGGRGQWGAPHVPAGRGSRAAGCGETPLGSGRGADARTARGEWEGLWGGARAVQREGVGAGLGGAGGFPEEQAQSAGAARCCPSSGADGCEETGDVRLGQPWSRRREQDPPGDAEAEGLTGFL